MPDGFRNKLLELRKTEESKMKKIKEVLIDNISEENLADLVSECNGWNGSVVSAIRTKDWNGTCKPYVYYHYFDIDTLRNIAAS